mgnify:CR=1 FL=1
MTIKVTTVGLAEGVIEVANFLTAAQVDVYKAWNATVHNIGDTGLLALGVVNSTGNPGSITIREGGEELVISPNQYLRYSYPDPVVNCTRITISAEVKFSVKGTYTIMIWGMHGEDSTWIMDDEKSFTVTVTEEPAPEPTLWERLLKFIEENPLIVVVAVGAVIGGWAISRRRED